ncbi:MAG: Flagellar protein FlbD, partial [uncultured Quadrisphaera sp.]
DPRDAPERLTLRGEPRPARAGRTDAGHGAHPHRRHQVHRDRVGHRGDRPGARLPCQRGRRRPGDARRARRGPRPRRAPPAPARGSRARCRARHRERPRGRDAAAPGGV